MRVVFDDDALNDLRDIFSYIAKDNPDAATRFVAHIFDCAERLALPELTYLGHSGQVKNTFELIVAPYIIVYEVRPRRGKIIVLSVMHGTRDR